MYQIFKPLSFQFIDLRDFSKTVLNSGSGDICCLCPTPRPSRKTLKQKLYSHIHKNGFGRQQTQSFPLLIDFIFRIKETSYKQFQRDQIQPLLVVVLFILR